MIDRATAADRVAASMASFARAGFGLWALEPRAGGALLGVAGLVVVDPALGPEILYALAPEHPGAGYATEAAAVLAYAFETLALARVAGRTDTPHRASVRVLEPLGMRFEGEQRVNGAAYACYALERADRARLRR